MTPRTMSWLAAVALLVACGDSRQPGDDTPWERVYALAITQMANTPAATSVLTTTSSLGPEATVDLGRGVALPDTATLFGIEGEGRIYATLAQTPRVLRYDVTPAGELREGPVLDLSGLGLGSTFSTRSIVFLEGSEAVLLDDTTLQAVVFDREAMAILRTFDLAELGREGFRTNFAYNLFRRDGDIVITAFYYSATYSRAAPENALGFLDPTDGELRVVRDSRCAAFSTVARMPNGDLYFGSDTFSVALRRVGGDDAAPAGCLLRLPSGSDAFDPDFHVLVEDLTGGDPGGGVVPAGPESVWVRAFDDSLFEVGPATSALHVLAAPAWHWWRVDLSGETPVATRADAPPGAGQVRYFSVEGQALAGEPDEGYASTELIGLGAEGLRSGLLLGPGLPAGVVRAH